MLQVKSLKLKKDSYVLKTKSTLNLTRLRAKDRCRVKGSTLKVQDVGLRV